MIAMAVSASAATSTKKKDRVDQSLPNISLISLLATPDKYDGKRVRVHGVFALALEVQILFPSQDLAISPSNGFWIDDDFSEPLTDFEIRKKKEGDKSEETWFEVQVEATFLAAEHGHLGLSAGGFKDVTRFEWIRRIRPPNKTTTDKLRGVAPALSEP